MTSFKKKSTCLPVQQVGVILFSITLFINSVIAQNWQSLGSPSVGSANVTDLVSGRAAKDPSPTVYSVQGTTIYRSTDGAVTWTTTASVNGTPLAVTCQQSTPSRVVIYFRDVSSYGYVVYSNDNGMNWYNSNVGPNMHTNAFRLATYPANQQAMLMGMEKFNGFVSMRISGNAGLYWSDVTYFFGNVQTDVVALAPHKTNAIHVFAGGVTPPPRMSAAMGVLSEPPPIYTKGGFFSTDGGVNWNRFTNSRMDSNIVAMVAYKRTGYNTNYIFAATDNGVLLRASYTSNPSVSQTWTKMSFPQGMVINDLTVDGNNVLYAATSNAVWKSTNHGSDWSSPDVGMFDKSNMRRVTIDPQSGYNIYSSSPSFLYKSTDAACTWREVAPNPSVVNSILAVAANGSTLLANPSGFSAVSRNPGSNWSTLGFSNIYDFVGKMVGFKSSDGVVVLDVGYRTSANTASLMRNGNYGDNACGNVWTQVRSGTTPGGRYNGFITDPANSDRVYAFGLIQNGNSSTNTNENYSVGTNGGTNWERNAVPTRTQTNISEISDFVADSTNRSISNHSLKLFAAIYSETTGDQGLWKSTNGGVNWTRVLNQPVRAIGFNPKVASIIYAAGSNTALYKSTNNGSTWTTSNTLPGDVARLLMHPSYLNSSNYFWIIVGGIAYKTKDGGTTWSQVTTGGLPSGTIFNDLRRDLTSNTLIYAATNNGVWRINPAPEPPTGLFTSSHAHCPCDYPPGCTSTLSNLNEPDAEAPPPDPCPWHYYAKLMWGANIEVDVNTSGGTYSIYRSTSPNGGYSLIASVPYTSTSYVDWSVRLPNSTTYYYKMTVIDVGGNVSDTSIIVSIGGSGAITAPNPFKETVSVPSRYELLQNIPNPFNPTTQINYALPVEAFVSLKVYDILGREVTKLVEEYQDAGYKSVTFDASQLSNGIYFYRLQVHSIGGGQASSFTNVKKMLLTK